MESNQNTTTPLASTRNRKDSSLTPRELINYHIENPEVPITDEDIQNLNLDHQFNSNFPLYYFRPEEE